MRNTKGAADPMLIFEKTLFETDVKPSQSRLSIPFHKLIRNDFLIPAESRIIVEDISNREKMGLGAVLVDQGIKKWGGVSQEMGDERFLELRFGLWVERCC